MIAQQRLLITGIAAAMTLHGYAVTSVSLKWDASPSGDAVGYKLYCALADGSSKSTYDVGNVTSAMVGNLAEGKTYSFYATAYNNTQTESGPSNTLTYTVPAATNQPPANQPTNHPPVMAQIPNQSADEGKLLQFTISASDPDEGQKLSFSVANAPAGAAINKDTGVFSWTPQSGQAPGSTTVGVVVTDNGQPAMTVSQSFNIVAREGFYLTVNSSRYGTATASPRGSLNSAGTKYISGIAVSVTATAANSYKFHHWELDGASYAQNPLSLTMNANHTLVSYFARGSQVVSVAGLSQ
jgi:hypothetical protein